MKSVFEYIRNVPPVPSIENQSSLWRCEGQQLISPLVRGLSAYEQWTYTPSSEAQLSDIADRFEEASKDWRDLQEENLEDLICLLSNLELGAAFYLLTWLEHNAITNKSALEKVLAHSRVMSSTENQTKRNAGKKMWRRMTCINRIFACSKLIVDGSQQRILS